MPKPSPDSLKRGAPEGAASARVAWLFPSLARAYYWQPIFREFAAHYPHTAVFTSIWPGFVPGYENAFEVHTLPGLRYVRLKKDLPDSRRGFIWTPLSIVRKLAKFKPDVVFCSGFSGWTLSALLCKLFRGSRAIIYWEGCSAQSVGASRLKASVRRWIARFADAAISNSDEGTRYLREVIGMPAEKLLRHPCQVPDLSLLSQGEASVPSDLRRPIFLYVGSINPRKGWSFLLRATELLVERGLCEFSVLFVGAGEQDEELRTRINNQHLDGIVHRVGAVAYHNLGSYYGSADVFVSPTRADTWGVAVLEAMAFGKAVLCSKYAGSRELVAQGENGFVFDPFDASELADYMAMFVRNPALAAEFGARSLEKMASYTPARSAEVLANLALHTMEARGNSSHQEVNQKATSASAHGVGS